MAGIAPPVTRVAVLRDAAIPSGTGQWGAIQSVAPSFGVELIVRRQRSFSFRHSRRRRLSKQPRALPSAEIVGSRDCTTGAVSIAAGSAHWCKIAQDGQLKGKR
jgi:hypothetical protein